MISLVLTSVLGATGNQYSHEKFPNRVAGFLNDDSNPVGAVHLGVVFTVKADGHSVEVRERDKLSGRFARPDEVRQAWDRLETWSQLVARDLLGIGP